MSDITISSSAAPTPQSRPQAAPAAETAKVQAPPSFVQAPYFSPTVKFDPSTQATVVMYRESDTGEPIRQVELGALAAKTYGANTAEGSKTTASNSTASTKGSESVKRSRESTEKAEVETETSDKAQTDTVV